MFVRRLALPLVTDGEIDGALVAYSIDCFSPWSSTPSWFSASCCRDGSLAVTQPIPVGENSEEINLNGSDFYTAGNVRASV